MEERKFWIVLYTHRHGIDTWPVFDKEPSIESLKDELEERSYEPDREDEYIEWFGPFIVPETPSIDRGE